MADVKRYYWLRLHDDFFRAYRIKKLRKMAGGDTYVIIYLKMQLKAMKTDGVLTWKGYEDDFVYELAGDLDEEPDDVRVTLAYLLSCGLAETEDRVNFFLPYAVENTGSETASTQRSREYRAKLKALKNQKSLLQCNTNATDVQRECNVEKEIEKEIDTRDREDNTPPTPPKGARRFTPPTLEEVKAYCAERGGKVDAENWYDWYSANGWKVGKNPMKDWKAAVRTWERGDRGKPEKKPKYTKNGMPVKVEPLEGGDDLDRLVRQLGVQS